MRTGVEADWKLRMTEYVNRAVRVVRAPRGLPVVEDFRIDEVPIRPPADGEVLFRAHYLSIDPAIRRRLPSTSSAPGPLGAVAGIGDVVLAGVVPAHSGLDGIAVGEVISSRHPDFAAGDLVRGGTHWQVYHTIKGAALDRIPRENRASLGDELGILGQPGFVAHCGMRLVADVRERDTVVVSAAGGAVGMVAGQIAKLAGARVIGIAGGEKTEYVVEELGFDACIDRKTANIGEQLDELCPKGVDVYFDNVGGSITRAVFDRMADFGRVVVCGMISEYNQDESEVGPPLRPVLRKRLRIEGFVCYDHYDRYPEYRAWASARIAEGGLRYRNDVTEGIENAPAALIGQLSGHNRGKQLVRI